MLLCILFCALGLAWIGLAIVSASALRRICERKRFDAPLLSLPAVPAVTLGFMLLEAHYPVGPDLYVSGFPFPVEIARGNGSLDFFHPRIEGTAVLLALADFLLGFSLPYVLVAADCVRRHRTDPKIGRSGGMKTD